MSNTYSVVLTGKLLDGFEPKSVQEAFSELFKLSQDKVQAYFNGQPKVVKKAVDRQTATRFKAKIEGLGASVKLRPVVEKGVVSAQKLKKATPKKTVKFPSYKANKTTHKKEVKPAPRKVKKVFTEFSLDDCINEIDFGRKKQISKMKAIEIAEQPRSLWTMLIGFGCLAFAASDLTLSYLGAMEISGTFWAPITAAVIGLVAINSSAEN